MLQTLFHYLTCFQGKSKNVSLVASVAIQENCLDSRQFRASFPAPFKVLSNGKNLVLSLVQSSLASQPVFFLLSILVGKKRFGIWSFFPTK